MVIGIFIKKPAYAQGGVSGLASFITIANPYTSFNTNRGCFFSMQAIPHKVVPFFRLI